MSTLEQTANKQWLDATIQNNFIFGKTLETHPDLCRRLLELILNVEIKEISYPEREKTINLRSDSKGIRLDVYVEEKGTNRSFDIEMQVSNSDNLAKRTRYYQELIDGDKLKPGQHYSALGESIIIFICPFSSVRSLSNIIATFTLSTNVATKNLILFSKVASLKFFLAPKE